MSNILLLEDFLTYTYNEDEKRIIPIKECKVSCPCCKTPLPETHPAFPGVIGNLIASLRAEIVSLRSMPARPSIETKIQSIKQQLVALNAEMPFGEKMP